MPDKVRLSPQTLLVLEALGQAASEWRYGYDLSRETGLQSGTLYPILSRLAERKWLETCWQPPEENGRPRHLYRLTSEGLRSAKASLHKTMGGVRVLKPARAR